MHAAQTPVLVHNCDPVANKMPEDLSLELLDAEMRGVSAVYAGSGDFAKAMATDGQYLWAVDDAGKLGMVSAQGASSTP